jgi:hypothetical protein
MNFKYVGETGFKDIDLVIYGIMEKGDELVNGMTFTVPDEQKSLIKRLQVNGNYVQVKRKRRNK